MRYRRQMKPCTSYACRQGQALDLLTLRQYEHAARLADEVGRLIGGWRKQQGQARRGELPDGDRSG